jgi:hypothetical protein
VFIVTANLVHGIWCTRQSLQRMRDWDAQFAGRQAPASDCSRGRPKDGPLTLLHQPAQAEDGLPVIREVSRSPAPKSAAAAESRWTSPGPARPVAS